MKQKLSLARIATVVSSLVLAGGYVAYRSIWSRAPVTNAGQAPADAQTSDAEPDKELLSGSKRGVIFTPQDTPGKHMGGSKSMLILDPADVKALDPKEPEDEKPAPNAPANKKPEPNQPPAKPAEKPKP